MNTPTVSSAPAALSTDRLPVSLKLGWATGALGISILMNGIAGLILLFAASILQIDPWLAGVVIFLSKIVDMITDPIVGMWSDRHRSSKGRRRPFLLWGSILAAASFGLIFAAPAFGNQYGTAAYLFVLLSFYSFAYTLYNIPYLSMPSEMTDNYHERSSIHAYRMVFVSLGAMVTTSGIKVALEWLGKTEAKSYALVGMACAAVILVTTMIGYLSTRRARFTEPGAASADSNAAQMLREFKAVKRNPHFMRLIGVKLAQLMAVQTGGAGFAYFFVQTLKRDFNVLALFGVAVSISTIIFSPVLVKLSKRIGKKGAYYVAGTLNIAYVLSWSIAEANDPVWTILARGALVGIAFSGNVVMAMSMLTDIINEDANRTGVRREGAFTSLYSFVEKLAAAIGPLIVGFSLSIAGFDNKLPFDVPQGGNVDTALLAAVSWLPAFFFLIAIWLLGGYNLTEQDISKAKYDGPKT
jgi:GPH family glycoside/pentoside/hexuronide:cation symporter